MTHRRNFLRMAAASSVAASLPAIAQIGQQPIKIMVGFVPGGTSDMISRLMAEKIARIMGQPVVVENRPGAGGHIAALVLKHSQPDGLTYLLGPNATPIFMSLLYPEEVLKFNFFKDFEVVSMVTSFPLVIAVPQQLGVRTLKEFAQWLKANPQAASFGTTGTGGQTHFSGLRLGEALGTPMQVVPYRGNAVVVSDMLGGRLSSAILPAGDVLPHVKSGAIQVLAVFDHQRSPLLPEVPTLKEAGVQEMIGGAAWMALWGNAQALKEITQRFREAVRQTLTMQDIQDAIRNNFSMMATYQGPEEVLALQRKELAYWEPIIKASGFTPES